MLSNDLATISLHLRSRLDLDDAIRHDQDAMFLASEFDDGKLAPAQQSCCSIYPEVFSLCSSIRWSPMQIGLLHVVHKSAQAQRGK